MKFASHKRRFRHLYKHASKCKNCMVIAGYTLIIRIGTTTLLLWIQSSYVNWYVSVFLKLPLAVGLKATHFLLCTEITPRNAETKLVIRSTEFRLLQNLFCVAKLFWNLKTGSFTCCRANCLERRANCLERNLISNFTRVKYFLILANFVFQFIFV